MGSGKQNKNIKQHLSSLLSQVQYHSSTPEFSTLALRFQSVLKSFSLMLLPSHIFLLFQTGLSTNFFFFFLRKKKKKSLKKAVPSWIFAWTVALVRKNLHHCWLSLIFSISYALKNLLHLWHWCSLCYPILQTSHYQNLTIYSMVNNFTV